MTNHIEQIKALVECGKKAHSELWVSGGCSGRMITDDAGYVGDGFLADFDTKANCEFAIQAANSRPSLEKLLADYERMKKALKEIDALVHRSMQENYGAMQFVCGSDAKLIQQISRKALAEEQGE